MSHIFFGNLAAFKHHLFIEQSFLASQISIASFWLAFPPLLNMPSVIIKQIALDSTQRQYAHIMHYTVILPLQIVMVNKIFGF
jgi:hypothetical protein